MKRDSRNKFRSKNSYSILEERQMLASVMTEMVNGFNTLVIDGTNGDDVVSVETESAFGGTVTLNDMIFAFAGNVEIQRVLFLGRDGNDHIIHNSMIDLTAYGHAGNDIIEGGSGHNRIQGGSGDDQITGGDRNDILRGRDGNDTIDGGKRHDRIFGGAGNDLIVAGQGNDVVQGEQGDDIISGDGGRDRIDGGSGADDIDFGDGFGIAIYDSTFADFTGGFDDLDLLITDAAGDIDRLMNPAVVSFSDIDVVPQDYSLELNEIETESFRLVNELRAENERNPLFAKLDLSNYARNRAQVVAQQLGPNPTNFELLSAQSTLHDIEPLVNNARTLYTENITFVASQNLSPVELANEIHESIVSFPLYLSNMIYTGNTEIGIGVFESDSGWYVVQSFFVTPVG